MEDILNLHGLNDLLLHKSVTPLTPEETRELTRISLLEVSAFKEADVREEIINPLLIIMGYRKGNEHSVDRERHIKFVGAKNKYIDYSLTVWEQDFWLIEAKRPNLNQISFGYDEASQAFEYASHPEIRAALVVICDGVKIELFDREVNVETPILKINIKNIVEDYKQLAAILSPVNVWLFYRRRLLRELDRAFEKESNLNRVAEFKDIMSSRLDGMRRQVLNNFRSNVKSEGKAHARLMLKSDPHNITECYFFVSQTIASADSMSEALLNECRNKAPFHTMYRLFPDDPRSANDFYYMHVIGFLVGLAQSDVKISWLPEWMGGNKYQYDKDKILEYLIPLLLSHFENDESRKVISLVSSAYRRLAKIFAVVSPQSKRSAKVMHILTRIHAPEHSWEQIVSSPERNMMFEWQNFSILATERFVRRFSDERGFKHNLAKEELSQIYQAELSLLNAFPNYPALLKESDIDEIHPTELCGLSYDFLGHGVLCVLKNSEKWKNWVIENHSSKLVELAKLGSWAARELLGEDIKSNTESKYKYDASIASKRFFFGDDELQKKITDAYRRLPLK